MESKQLVITPVELVVCGVERLPPLIAATGERAGRRFIEFFTANIRNKNTRLAYARAVGHFFASSDRGSRLGYAECLLGLRNNGVEQLITSAISLGLGFG